jgi:hypothetical protein
VSVDRRDCEVDLNDRSKYGIDYDGNLSPELKRLYTTKYKESISSANERILI